MDSNFKLNKLYVFSDLTIAKVVNEHYSYPTFKEIKRNKEFVVDINSRTLKCTELFFKIEEDKHYTASRFSYSSFQFLTDSFQLVFHRHSSLIQTKNGCYATLLYNRNHIDCILKYEDKFILKVFGKQVEDLLISNFDRDVAEPILQKHNRLFECL